MAWLHGYTPIQASTKTSPGNRETVLVRFYKAVYIYASAVTSRRVLKLLPLTVYAVRRLGAQQSVTHDHTGRYFFSHDRIVHYSTA